MTERSVQEQAAFDALNAKIRHHGTRHRATAHAPYEVRPDPEPIPEANQNLNAFIRSRSGRQPATDTTEEPTT